MITGLHTAFDDFVGWVKRHDSSACMEDFSICINDPMAREIDESLLTMPRNNQNSVDGYFIGGIKVEILHELFPPEPPLIWFRYGFMHGRLYALDENWNLIPAIEHPKFKVKPFTPPKDEWQIVI